MTVARRWLVLRWCQCLRRRASPGSIRAPGDRLDGRDRHVTVRVLDPLGRWCIIALLGGLLIFIGVVFAYATRHASRHEFGGRPSWGTLSHDGFQNSGQHVIFHVLRD